MILSNNTGAWQVTPEEALELKFIDLETGMQMKSRFLEWKSDGFYKVKNFLLTREAFVRLATRTHNWIEVYQPFTSKHKKSCCTNASA